MHFFESKSEFTPIAANYRKVVEIKLQNDTKMLNPQKKVGKKLANPTSVHRRGKTSLLCILLFLLHSLQGHGHNWMANLFCQEDRDCGCGKWTYLL